MVLDLVNYGYFGWTFHGWWKVQPKYQSVFY